MKKFYFLGLVGLFFMQCSQQKEVNYLDKERIFYKDQKKLATVWKYLSNHLFSVYSQDQFEFSQTIDSLQTLYANHLQKNKKKLRLQTYKNEEISIKAAFSDYYLKYPNLHYEFTGKTVVLSTTNKQKIQSILPYLNNSKFLLNTDLQRFAKSYIALNSEKVLQTGSLKNSDNQQLLADWRSIESLFHRRKISRFWKQKYLYEHLDQMGVKNIDSLYHRLISDTPEPSTKLVDLYTLKRKERNAHLIEIYKQVDNHQLETHLFLPDTLTFKGPRPTMVHFHGGSWSKGTPEWYFKTAEAHRKKGWVVAVVEYRTKGRHGTSPFEAVKDAKSAIRWLRTHHKKFGINPTKILATGNSAGGHLALATSLVENWNAPTDNLQISAKPDVVIVNSAAYDLTHRHTKWIVKHLNNKQLVKEISPIHIVKKTTSNILLIHGEKDTNCPYNNAKAFYNHMRSLGNNIRLHTVKNASHFFWFGSYPEVSKITQEYLKQQFY